MKILPVFKSFFFLLRCHKTTAATAINSKTQTTTTTMITNITFPHSASAETVPAFISGSDPHLE